MRKLILMSIALFSVTAFAQKQDITLMDIWGKATFYPKTISGFVNLNDGKSYCIQESDEKQNSVVNSYDYTSGNKTGVVIDGAKIAAALGVETFTFSSFQLSDDQKKALLQYNVESIYRHSTRADVLIVDLTNYSVKKLVGGKVRYPSFDPKAEKIAFVRDNDMYVYFMDKGKTKRLTKDGEYNNIINGAVDWVYEEEFSMSKGYQWNVDGSKLAFYRFDESAVKEWVMPMYGDLYPQQYKFKYPKAGEDNSIVEVHICDVSKMKHKALELGSENDQYLPRIKWTKDPNVLSIQRLNRLQNKWELLLANEKGEITQSLQEESEYYVDITDDIHYLSDKEHMIVKSAKDGFYHLYFHKVAGPQVFPITKGKWEVDEVLAVDEKNKLIYYTSTEVSSMERHIYVVNFEGKNKKRLTKAEGTHSAKFSNDYSMALHTYSHPVAGMEYSIKSSNWEQIRLVEDNAEFKERLNNYNISPIEYSELTTEEGVKLNYYMIKPMKLDSGKKYPLFMFVYGGPGSQNVTKGYLWSNYFWFQMLANKHNIVVACVDNRGTGGKGQEFKQMTYKQLGKYETIDQIASAKYFGKMDFIDEDRIGIWGWSYGGYMSSLCLAKGNETFKMAIAVAPVTNWRYYDNIYTERYMQRPQENAEGYDQNSPINFVKDIKGKYLIVHGTGDDNVHFQNTVMMVNELIKYNIPFDSEFYPNRNHGIYGGATRYHLYNKMTNFILENL